MNFEGHRRLSRVFKSLRIAKYSGKDRTSTPILESKKLIFSKEHSEYSKFCMGLEKSCKEPLLLNRGCAMEKPGESMVSGHIVMITKEDLDELNKALIIDNDLKQTIRQRIRNILDRSFKSVSKKAGKFGNQRSSQRRVVNEFQCKNVDKNPCHSFIDAEDVRNRKQCCCNVNKSNIILINNTKK